MDDEDDEDEKCRTLYDRMKLDIKRQQGNDVIMWGARAEAFLWRDRDVMCGWVRKAKNDEQPVRSRNGGLGFVLRTVLYSTYLQMTAVDARWRYLMLPWLATSRLLVQRVRVKDGAVFPRLSCIGTTADAVEGRNASSIVLHRTARSPSETRANPGQSRRL